MKYDERKNMMAAFDPAQLENAKAPQKAQAYAWWHVIQLLADIAENFASFAYSQSQLLKIAQSKSGAARPPARNPGDGQ